MKNQKGLIESEFILIALIMVALVTIWFTTKGDDSSNEKLSYLVTKTGLRVELVYLGDKKTVPESWYTITKGMDSLGICALQTQGTTIKPYCQERSHLQPGNIATIARQDLTLSGHYKDESIHCSSCGKSSLEGLYEATKQALNEQKQIPLSDRVDKIEKNVEVLDETVKTTSQELDKKIDNNLQDTVQAVKKVYSRVQENTQEIQKNTVDTIKNTENLKDINNLIREVNPEYETKKDLEHTKDPFDFLE